MTPATILATVLVGLLSSIWGYYCPRNSPSTIGDEAWIGWLTWGLLYVGCVGFSHKRHPAAGLLNATTRPNEGLWTERLIVAGLSVAVTIAHLTKSRGILPLANPVVTLATLLAAAAVPGDQDALHMLEAVQAISSRGFQKPSLLDRPIPSLQLPLRFPVNLLLVMLLAGSVSYANSLSALAITTNLLFVVAQTIIFTSLPRLSHRSQAPFSTVYTLLDWDLLGKLSLSSTACFTCLLIYSILTSAFHLPDLMTLFRVVTESASWVSLFILCSENSEKLAITATTFETVATSFDAVASVHQGWRLLWASTSSIVALWQSVTDVPLGRKSRNWLYLLLCIPLLSLVHSKSYRSIGSEQQELTRSMHPVEGLVQDARREFSDLLSVQSKTVEQARTEYVRRYDRIPPPNFDKWFELAIQYDFVLVDEFDSIMRMLEPFWGLAPSVVQRLVTNAHEHFSAFLVKYEVLDGNVTITGEHEASWFAASMKQLLPAEWAGLLPNMTLAVNRFDEPTVCAPRDTLDMALRPSISNYFDPSSLSDADQLDSSRPLRFLDLGKQDAWEAMILSCPANSPARSPICVPPASNAGLSFIRNLTESRNICEHCELQNLEGFLMAPENLHLTHSLIPIWSQGRPSTFNDIIFPSPFYFSRGSDYVEAEDPEWGDKASRLYWVGAATGGHTTEANWNQMQRQRMALMTQAGSTTPIRLLHESESGGWIPYASNTSEVSPLFSTRVVGVTPQCEEAACKAQKQAFGIGDEEVKDPASAAYTYKFVLDLDGNSFSGRFYRLLHSKSAVIKQTVFEEWHDDRLIPWIHYIPVSTAFDELPELVRFLATTESGEEIAARVAQESRDWAGKALRQVDLQLVWMRMLMEYGRIVDQNRNVLE